MLETLPCCLEVSSAFEPKARYALRVLLEPLRLGPVFVSRSSLDGHGLYYGTSPAGLPESTTVLPHVSDAAELGAGSEALDPTTVTWREWESVRYPVLFANEGSDDLIASAFVWLTGWQEHATLARDQHGRCTYADSLSAALQVTDVPVVDIYRAVLLERLRDAGLLVTSRSWGRAAWTLCPTIDVDYLRKWRPGMIFRELVEYFLLNRRRVTMASRVRRLGAFLADSVRPSDVFRNSLSQMHSAIRQLGTGTIFLKADAHGPMDVHYSLNQRYVGKSLSTWQHDGFEIALHPSYHAHNHPQYLRMERASLMALTGQAPVSVRQHFLRHDGATTSRLQETSGFRIDSTLAFAETAGFRRGTCLPFHIFDIQRNAETDLWEMPLIIMDSALFNRQGLEVDEAIRASRNLLDWCKRFGGVAVVLWHNVLLDQLDFPEWDRHFQAILEYARAEGAQVASLRTALESWLGHSLA